MVAVFLELASSSEYQENHENFLCTIVFNLDSRDSTWHNSPNLKTNTSNNVSVTRDQPGTTRRKVGLMIQLTLPSKPCFSSNHRCSKHWQHAAKLREFGQLEPVYSCRRVFEPMRSN